MKMKFSNTLVLLFIFILSIFTSHNLQGQILKENFDNNSYPDWYVKNNTQPLTRGGASWQMRPYDPWAGAEFGQSNFTSIVDDIVGTFSGTLSALTFGLVKTEKISQRFDYAVVGYTPDDYDGANMSQWLVTPYLRGLKNGDKVYFRTRSQPLDFNASTTFKRLWSTMNLNFDDAGDQNRPNRLEVRLDTNANQNGINLPNKGADDFGGFNILLKVVNPNLTNEGYPQTWTVFEATITGLKNNKLYNGRIGFWYHFPNGGYNNYRSRYSLPGPDATVFAIADQANMPVVGYIGPTLSLLSRTQPQIGRCGTYVGITDIEVKAGNEFFLLKPNKADEFILVNGTNTPSSAEGTKLGYDGSRNCANASGFNYQSSLTLINQSGSNPTFTYQLNGSGKDGFIVELKPPANGKNKLGINISLKEGISPATKYAQLNLLANGVPIGTINLAYEVNPAKPPTAICTGEVRLRPVSATDERFILRDTSAVKFSNGSVDCTPIASRTWVDDFGNPIAYKEWTCNDVSSIHPVKIKVTNTAGQSSTCQTNVRLAATIDYYNNICQNQTYFLKSNELEMAYDSLNIPILEGPCSELSTVKAEINWKAYYDDGYNGNRLLNYSSSLVEGQSFEVGNRNIEYRFNSFSGDFAGYCKQSVTVVDTIKPIITLKDTFYADFALYKEVPFRTPAEILIGLKVYRFKIQDILTSFKDNTETEYDKSKSHIILDYGSGFTQNQIFGNTEVRYGCADANGIKRVLLRMYDIHGNFSEDSAFVKFADYVQPKCIKEPYEVLLNHANNGVSILYPIRLMDKEDSSVVNSNQTCSGLFYNLQLQNNIVTCNDVYNGNDGLFTRNVTFLDAGLNQGSCDAPILAKDEPIRAPCQDTVVVFVPASSTQALYQTNPPAEFFCNTQGLFSRTYGYNINGTENFDRNSVVGQQNEYFYPGINRVKYLQEDSVYGTFRCNQTVVSIDNIPPLPNPYISMSDTGRDIGQWAPNISIGPLAGYQGCYYEFFDIYNPFYVQTLDKMTVEITGASADHYTFEIADLYGNFSASPPEYTGTIPLGMFNSWKARIGLTPSTFENLDSGITTVVFKATDYAGNVTELTRKFQVRTPTLPIPNLGSDILTDLENKKYKPFSYVYVDNWGTNVGEFQSEFIEVKIPSPLEIKCESEVYKWFYKVKDYDGTITAQADSLHQDSGATLYLRTGPSFNVNHRNEVEIGYYYFGNNKTTIIGPTTYSIVYNDEFTVFKSPEDTLLDITTDQDYINYTIPKPVNLPDGSVWGFELSGSTLYKTPQNTSSLNKHQLASLQVAGFGQDGAFPSISADSSITLPLNIGINYLKYVWIEPSGNLSSFVQASVTHKATVRDVSSPTITCPANDSLYIPDSTSCTVSIGGPCQQITGFTGPYGATGIGLFGKNLGGTIDKSDLPNSVTFNSNKGLQSENDLLIRIRPNCSGTISFNWEYSCTLPQFFKPVVEIYDENGGHSKSSISGFSAGNPGTQTGSFSLNVGYGFDVFIGIDEAGIVDGNFKITNFTAPYSDPSVTIGQPSFLDKTNTNFRTTLNPELESGTHNIYYEVSNHYNGNLATCNQTIVVVDTFNRSLVCKNDTLFLDQNNKAFLTSDDFITSCFPLEGLVLSQDSFTCSNIGVIPVSATAFKPNGDSATCSVNITIVDTVAPLIDRTAVTVLGSSIGQYQTKITDNCGVASHSANPSSFSSCDILPEGNIITISATDLSGNITTEGIKYNFYPLGVGYQDYPTTDTVCAGEPFTLRSSDTISTYYDWRVNDLNDTNKYWSKYASADITTFSAGSEHQFRVTRDEVFDKNVSFLSTWNTDFSSAGKVKFYKLNPDLQHWEQGPAQFTDVQSHIFPNHYSSSIEGMNLIYLNNQGSLMTSSHQNNQWATGRVIAKDSQSGFVYSGFQDLYYNHPYYYAVFSNGFTFVGSVSDSGYVSDADTLFDGNVGATSATINIKGAGKIAYVHNNGQNLIYEFQSDSSLNSTSLSSDPANNSSTFELTNHNNVVYLAHKTSNNKVSVHQYNGNNSWSIVGNTEFSKANISQLDIASLKGNLFVAYSFSTDSVALEKFNGSNWDLVSTQQIGSSSIKIELIDIQGAPGILRNKVLWRYDNWKELPSLSNQENINIPTVSAGHYLYQSTAYGTSCVFNVSEPQEIVVNQQPTISVSDRYIQDSSLVVISANASKGTVLWSDKASMNNILFTGSSIPAQIISGNLSYYAFASDKGCASDTVKMDVYILMDSLSITHDDSICPESYAEISLDFNTGPKTVELYKQTTANEWEFYQGPTTGKNLGFYPDSTANYRVKLLDGYNNSYNAGGIEYIQNDCPSCDNGKFAFVPTENPTNEITMEAWVYIEGSGSNIAATNVFNMTTYNTNNPSLEWQGPIAWKYGYFYVTNFQPGVGGGTRQVTLPAIQGANTNKWMHLATVASSDSLKIYYNGQLVKAEAQSSTYPIKSFSTDTSNAAVFEATQYLQLVDEIKIWKTARTQAQIRESMNACQDPINQDLIFYNSFSKKVYAPYGLRHFTKGVGSAVSVLNDYGFPLGENFRKSACETQQPGTRYSEPFSIAVLNNLPYLTNYDGYFESPNDSACGLDVFDVYASASSGNVRWYDAEEGGNLIFVGDTLTVSLEKDTVFYISSESDRCGRRELEVTTPVVPLSFYARPDTFCIGDRFRGGDFEGYISGGIQGFGYFTSQTDTNLIYGDKWEDFRNSLSVNEIDSCCSNELACCPYFGGGEDGPSLPSYYINQTDTLWVEGYGQYCKTNRVPFVVHTQESKVTNISADKVICQDDSVRLFIEWTGGDMEFDNGDDWVYVGADGWVTTSLITETTTFEFYLDNDCDIDENYFEVTVFYGSMVNEIDVTVNCDNYDWRGNNFTQSGTYFDSLISNSGCDSILQLNLILDQGVQFVNNATITCGPYLWRGNTYTAPGLYYDTLINSLGCDSIIQLNLQYILGPTIAYDKLLCPGGSTNLELLNTNPLFTYTLFDALNDSSIIGPIVGNGATLSHTTQSLYQDQAYYTNATSTSTLLNQGTGSALDFDGDKDRVNCGNDTSVQITGTNITLEAWVYPKYFEYSFNSAHIISKETNSPDYGYMLRTGSNGRINFNIGSGSWNEITTPNSELVLNEWQHVAATYDGTTMRIYVNGSEVYSQNKTFTIGNSDHNLTIGGYPNGGSEFTGMIDEVKVWKITRSPSEILADMFVESDGSDMGLVAYYNFDQDSTSTILDLANNNNGTLLYFDTLADWTNGFGPSYNTCSSYTTDTIYVNVLVDTNVFNVATCESFELAGNTYTQSGSYTDTLASSLNCDSIVTINLTILNPTIDTLEIVECNSYQWIGTTFSASGIYFDTLVNNIGCDSLMVLDLTINNSSSSILGINSCGNYIWLGNEYTQNGHYFDTIPNTVGCDSVMQLYLAINPIPFDTFNITSCNSYTRNGKVYTISGSYNDTVFVANSCDSIITLNLTINSVSKETLSPTSASVCVGFSATISSASSEIGVQYSLKNGLGNTVDGPISGTGSSLSFNTGNLNSSDNFYVIGEKSTSCLANSDTVSIIVNQAPIISIMMPSTPTLNGTNEGLSIWGPSQVAADNLAGWQGVNIQNLFVTMDENYVYFAAEAIGVADWMSWGFTINTKNGGGNSDPFGHGNISFSHTELPDFVIRGGYTNNSYNREIVSWDGNAWQYSGLNSSDFGITEGFVEIRVAKSILNISEVLDVQFFVTGNDASNHATFDAVPDDQNTTAWNGSPTALDNYSSFSPNGLIGTQSFTTLGTQQYIAFPFGGSWLGQGVSSIGLLTADGVFIDSISYSFTNFNNCVGKASLPTDVNVPCPLKETLTAANTNVCSGSSTTLTIASSEIGITYTLKDDLGVTIDGPTSGTGSSLSFNSGSLSSPSDFYLIGASSSGCSINSDTVTIGINSPTTWIDTIVTCNASFTWIDNNVYSQSNNTATFTLPNAAGCDSVVTLDLTMNSPSTRIDTVVTCNSSYKWIDNNVYSQSNNTATYTLPNATGCDSVVTLDLTMNSPTTWIDTIVTCNATYTWIDNNVYSQSNNTATFTLPNATGCDSVVTLDLTMNNPTTWIDTIVTCNASYTWIDNNVYSQSNNTATYTLPNAAGCDSVVTLDLTMNSPTTWIDTIVTCNATYTWIDNNVYSQSNNTATFTLPNSAGCDSVVTLDLTMNSPTTWIDTIVTCNATYTWIDNNVYSQSNNTATHTLPNAAGCDSVVTLDLTMNSPTTWIDTIVTCNANYTWIDNNVYSQSNNTATFTLPNAAGCDSVVTLDLTMNSPTTWIDTIVTCNASYTWIDNNVYSQSNNTATFTLPNAVGCDSVVTLDLTMNSPTTWIDTIVTCNATYTWIDNNDYNQSNNTATYTLPNAAGCDSVVTLDLTMNSPTTWIDTIVTCNATYTWIDNNVYSQSNNTATFTLPNAAGCDSVVTLDLTMNSPTTWIDTIVTCNATYTWIDNNVYSQSNNNATYTLPNASGCDSVVTLDLTMNSPTTWIDTIVTCNATYTWIDNNVYSQPNNTATFTLPNATGCDSVVTLDLTMNSPTTWIDTIVTCNATYTWIDNNVYSQSNNTATFTLPNATGCDSVVTLDLTMNSPTTWIDTIVTCNATYTWIDNNVYSQSNNTATFTLPNAAGCDSVVTLDLTMNSPTTWIDTIVTCNATYTWIDNNVYSQSNNTATFTLPNAAGCDSVVTLDLTMNSPSTWIDTIVTCNATYTWVDNIVYSQSNNTATFTLPNAAGCDSVVTLDLTMNSPSTWIDTIVTCNATYTWVDNIVYSQSNNTATFTLPNAAGCDSLITLDLTINSGFSMSSIDTICNGDTLVLGGSNYYTSGIYTDTLQTTNGCDSIVVTNLFVNTGSSLKVDTLNNPWCNQVSFLVSSTQSDLTYYWSDNTVGEQTEVSLSGGLNQSLTVYGISSNGCFSETATVNYHAADFIESYTLLANDFIRLKADNKVLNGAVGVRNPNGKLAVDNFSGPKSSHGFLKADSIKVTNHAQYDTLIFGAAAVNLPFHNTSTVIPRNFDTIYAQVGAIKDEYRKNFHVVAEKNSTIILNNDRYGDVTVNRGATVIFNNSNVEITNLYLLDGPSNSLQATVKFNQATNLRVRNRVELGKRATLNPDSQMVNIYIGGGIQARHFKFTPKGVNSFANVYVQNGIIKSIPTLITTKTNLTGRFIADTILAYEKSVRWNWSACLTQPTVIAPPAALMVNKASIEADEQLQPITTEVKIGATTLQLSPNPTRGNFMLNLSTTEVSTNRLEITITGQDGSLVMRKVYNTFNGNYQEEIDMSGLSNGVYFINVMSGETLIHEKLILTR